MTLLAGIRRIVDATVFGGYREVCETRAAWDRRRRECYDRARGLCENPWCGREAPIETEDGAPGHAHHVNLRGAGGSKRDDRLLNLRWLCWKCHWKWHNKKVLPATGWRQELAVELAKLRGESG
jgi:hypothetical protein